VHFNTDYIYRPDEPNDPKTNHLGVHATNTLYKSARDEAFRQIGRFFGVYTLKFGLKAYNDFPLKVRARGLRSPPLETIVKSLRPMLDTGLGQEALFTLLSMYEDGRIARSSLLAFAMVAQKCGFAEAFHRACTELMRPPVFTELPVPDRARLRILRLKFYTQVGDYAAAQEIVRQADSDEAKAELKSIDQFGAYLRRCAVVHAAAGQPAEAYACLDAAKLADNPDAHYIQTNKIFEHIVKLHVSDDLGLDELNDIAADLSEIRIAFCDLTKLESKWWQTNLEKCAIAALFLEAAFFLDVGGQLVRDQGMLRLFIAHFLNSRFGGNEASETYGEIVGAVREKAVRSIIALAMRRDPEAQIEFQHFIRSEHTWAVELSDTCLGLLRCAPIEREPQIRLLLEARR
jgi:hypothetical protein